MEAQAAFAAAESHIKTESDKLGGPKSAVPWATIIQAIMAAISSILAGCATPAKTAKEGRTPFRNLLVRNAVARECRNTLGTVLAFQQMDGQHMCEVIHNVGAVASEEEINAFAQI